MNGIDLPKDGL